MVNIISIHHFLNLNFIMQNQSSNAKVQRNLLKSYNGQKFGKLTILMDCGFISYKSGSRLRKVLTVCECGREKEIQLCDIKSGRTISCGCFNKKKAISHGMTYSKIYRVYIDMNKRCNNPRLTYYKNYGGRGIKNEFKIFEHFLETMSEGYECGLSLERIDVNGNYNPTNCKWVTLYEQRLNKRNTIKYKNVPLVVYCRENNISYNMVSQRLLNGWDIDKAVTTIKLK